MTLRAVVPGSDQPCTGCQVDVKLMDKDSVLVKDRYSSLSLDSID